ncbi:MAG: universal stress protein [Planctomycetaceae bacterium]|nr:universal stress protein [Planctomycetaceae bacterium]
MIKLQKILTPTDFSEFSKPALEYACEFASRFGAELHILHVIDASLAMPDPLMGAPVSDSEIRDLESAAGSALQALPGEAATAGVNVAARKLCMGTPFVEIIRYARQNDIDLIVMGTHGHTGLAHVMLGSSAERVVRKAPCPVLTVRPAGHDFVMP